jgi:hypothetical protein
VLTLLFHLHNERVGFVVERVIEWDVNEGIMKKFMKITSDREEEVTKR